MASLRKPRLNINVSGNKVTATLTTYVSLSSGEQYLCNNENLKFTVIGSLMEHDSYTNPERVWTFLPPIILTKSQEVRWDFTWPTSHFNSIVNTEPGDEELYGLVTVNANMQLNAERSSDKTTYND